MLSEQNKIQLNKIGINYKDLSEIILNFPTTVCIEKKSDGNFCAYSPHYSIGVFEGAKTPENAIIGLWEKIFDSNNNIKHRRK